jgi:CBS domain containing-hemolysin-like protein
VDFDDYIREISGEAQEENDIQQEIQMFQNVIDFRNIKVRECMVPRTEIIALDENDGIQKLKEIFVTTGYSRILVFRENIDNIISYVHAHDIFKGPDTIAEIAKQLLIVPEAMLASEAMSIFIHEHKSIALVVDEFGGTSGIVTMEDILEEILGEIEDEYDNDEFLEKQVSQNEYLLSGRLEIDYINEKYKLNIPVSDEYETLAGYILHHHESIPALEEKILIAPYVFYIQQASENRIEKVRLKVNLEE